MSLHTVDIKRVFAWQIPNVRVKSKYNSIELSFARKFNKCVDNLIYFTLLTNDININFIGESLKFYNNSYNAIWVFYNDYSETNIFWHLMESLAKLVVEDLVIEKYLYKLIDLMKDTLSKIKQLLGNTDEEIEVHYER